MLKDLSDKILDDLSQDAINLAKLLFPINRSINSKGSIQTLKQIQKHIPLLKIKYFRQQKDLDWDIPQRWNLKRAYIKRLNGETVIDSSDSNLHVISHSIGVKRSKMSFEKLKEKIQTIKEKPSAIPYRTSYYKKDWGFCMQHNKFIKMKDKEYIIEIDADFEHKPMGYGELIIPGKNKDKEILFSTYICHPSMANNELSGPVVSIALIKYLLSKRNQYSYRFLFLPETIGAIAYINKKLNILKKRIIAGLVLTCVGDERSFSMIKTKDSNNYLEKIMLNQFVNIAPKYDSNIKIYDFNLRQSDERQYCSPGVDLPISCFCRSKYATYPEYHTSDDDFNVVTVRGLRGSIEVLLRSLDVMEHSIFPKCKFLGEPNLGKRGLYPLVGGKKLATEIRDIKNFLVYSSGYRSLEEISKLINLSLKDAKNLYSLLQQKGLVS